MTERLVVPASPKRAEEMQPRYCPHPLHAERPEGRARLRFHKSALNHFCDACGTEGRVFDLAFGSERRRRRR